MDKVEEDNEERSDGKDLYRVNIQPLEISVVSVPADQNVGIGRNLTINNKGQTMEKSVEKKVAEQSKVNPDEIRKAELNRIREIEAIGSTHNRKDLAEKSIRSGHTVSEFKGLILDKIGSEKPLEQESHDLDLNAKEKRSYSLYR